MPNVTNYNLDDLNAHDDVAVHEMQERTKYIDSNWRYYEGEHKRPLRVKVNQTDDNVILNLASEVIFQSNALLFGKKVDFDFSDSEETPEEQALEALWKANDQQLWMHDLGITASVSGHAFVKLRPTGKPEQPIQFVRLNPRFVTKFWSSTDYQQTIAYRVQWDEGRNWYRQDVVDLGGQWLIRDLRKAIGSKQWEITGEANWQYPFAPIVDWKNLPSPESVYGKSDLVSPELNDSINFVASNTNRILKYHAHPKTIIVGALASAVTPTAVEGIFALENEKARVDNLEMQSDLQSSKAFLSDLQSQFYSENHVVNIESMKDRVGQLTNFGLQTLFYNALHKLSIKQSLYGKGLAEISTRALLMMGITPPNEVKVVWPDPLPYNRLEQVNALRVEKDMGVVSDKTAATELGRDWETEQARMQQEQTDQGNIGTELLRSFNNGTQLT